MHCTCSRLLPAVLLISASAFIVACGSTRDEDDTVAVVGSYAITRSALDHSMKLAVSSNYYALTRTRAPSGLVSDPPHYSRCLAAVSKLRSPTVGTAPPVASRTLVCRQLHASIEEFALRLLITGEWHAAEAIRNGEHVSSREVVLQLRHDLSQQYSNPQQIQLYLRASGATLTDLRKLVRQSLLGGLFLQTLQSRAIRAHRSLASVAHDAEASWIARTICSPAYRVNLCRQYSNAREVTPSSAVTLEAVVNKRASP
jgi:hypothetical protein